MVAGMGALSPVASPLVPPVYYNVKSAPFGALGGGHDDHAAIQAALNAVGTNGIVFFPPDVYGTSVTLTVGKRGTVLLGGDFRTYVGDNANGSRIKATNGANTDVLSITGTSDVQVRSLQIDGNSANNASGRGIIVGAIRGSIEDVLVADCAGDGVVINVADVTLNGLIAYNNGGYGLLVNAAGSDLMAQDVRLALNLYNLVVQGPSAYFSNLHVWSATNDGIVVQPASGAGVANISFTNLYTESNAQAGMSVYAVSGNTVDVRINNARFYENSTAGNNLYPHLRLQNNGAAVLDTVLISNTTFGNPTGETHVSQASIALTQQSTGAIRNVKVTNVAYGSSGASQLVLTGTIDSSCILYDREVLPTAFLTSGNVTMTNAATYYTAVTLGSALDVGGTYLLSGSVAINDVSLSGSTFTAELYDSTNATVIASISTTTTVLGDTVLLTIPPVVYRGYAGTPTILLRCQSSGAGDVITRNSATVASKQTYLQAERIG